MKKEVSAVLVILLCVLLCVFVNAQSDAYTWLKQQVYTGNLNTEQLSYALLALSNDNIATMIVNMLYGKSYNMQCFATDTASSEQACNAYDTAIAAFALSKAGKSITDILDWLKAHKHVVQVDAWYVQVITDNAKTCTLRYYDGGQLKEVALSITEQGIQLSNDNCVSVPDNFPFWLEIEQNCFDKEFVLQCDNTIKLIPAFKLANQLIAVSTVYGVGQAVSFKQDVYCIANANSDCDYVASALYYYLTHDSSVLPYLMLYASKAKEQGIFADAWLYFVTSQESFKQSMEKYKTILPGDKAYYALSDIYFDTCLAGLALSENADSTTDIQAYFEDYLGDNGINGDVIVTALALYVFWPSYGVACSVVGGQCKQECSSGEVQTQHYCSEGVCCKPTVCNPDWCKASCSDNEQQVQLFCESGVCCKPVTSNPSECDSAGGSCVSSCLDDEIQIDKQCDSGLVCCKKKSRATCDELHGHICGSNEECVVNNQIVSFITSIDSDRCCLGTCQERKESCDALGGVICSSGYCLNNQWLNAIEQYCCRRSYCADTATCSQLGGEICDSDEICKDGLMVATSDTQYCCVQGGKCVKRSCDGIGELCEPGEICDGTTVETAEGLCCVGECVGDCADMGGQICDEGYRCSTDFVEAADTSFCCLGECKKTNIALILIVLFGILAVSGLLFMLKHKYKPGKKRKQLPMQPSMQTQQARLMPQMRQPKLMRQAMQPIPQTMPQAMQIPQMRQTQMQPRVMQKAMQVKRQPLPQRPIMPSMPKMPKPSQIIEAKAKQLPKLEQQTKQNLIQVKKIEKKKEKKSKVSEIDKNIEKIKKYLSNL